MTEPSKFGDREPVRLPLWAATLAVGVVNLLIDLLSDIDWRTSLIGFLVTVPPILLGVEVARQRAWSPLAVWDSARAARAEERAKAAAYNVAWTPPSAPPVTVTTDAPSSAGWPPGPNPG